MYTKTKIIINIVVITMLLNGFFLTASQPRLGLQLPVAHAGGAVNRPAGQAAVNVSPADAEGGRDPARENSINEINRYLSQMDSADLAASLKLFRVMQLLKLQYPEDVPTAKLLSGALKGTVDALNDPYSVYMDPKMFKEHSIQISGSFSGVGIVLGTKDKVLTVVSPIEGTPGDQAGIRSGDQIVKINDRDTKDMALDEAVHLIRGPEGSKITLTISRPGEEVRDYTIIRANVQMKTVTGKMLESDIGYIRLAMFNEHTVENLDKTLKELEKQGMKAAILDLRNNPGGLLEEGVKTAGQFVPKGPVVSYVTRAGARVTFLSYLPAPKYPLVVLVNGGSASAAEIVAGAVQDTGAGTLIGTKTFGKGSMQRVIPLEDASAVKVTIAKWFTPKGRPIDGVGLEPDIQVEMPDFKENGKDLQLEKAVEVLKAKL